MLFFITAASHSSSSRFTFDSALPLSGPAGAAAFSFFVDAASVLSFFSADVASFFFAVGELAGEASAVGDAFVSDVVVGVDAEASTLAEAVSCGAAEGLSSCAKAEAAKLNAEMARSDVN